MPEGTMDIMIAVQMADANKALLIEVADKIGSAAKKLELPFRASFIDFLAQAIHAAEVVAREAEGVEKFREHLENRVKSYA